MKLDDIQAHINQWIEEYGVRYFDIMTNNALLMEEVGELSSLLAREYGEQSFKESESNENIKAQIADEMADIFFVLCCLANQQDINLTAALQKNLAKKTRRDKDRHKKNKKL